VLWPGGGLPPYFNKLEAKWEVPSLPSTHWSNYRLQFYFPSLDNNVDTILQPVLQFGYNGVIGSTNYWT
jgi:hypothetical protein